MDPTAYKVCIFGAGAVGGNMAAHLARAGIDVSIVIRGRHLEAVRAHGLRLVKHDEDFTVPIRASNDPAELGPQDLVISTLKAQDLSSAAASFGPLLKSNTPVLFAVNGVPWWYFHGTEGASMALPRLDPEGRLWQHIGPERALGCVIRSPNDLLEPGVIRSNSRRSSYTLGEPDGTVSPRLERVVRMLQLGLPGACATGNIRREIWTKLCLNVPSSILSVLTSSTGLDLFENPDTLELYRRLGEETAAIAAALGEDAGFNLQSQIEAAGNVRHTPSMLQDLLAGRQLEVDAQLCAVQDIARRLGVATRLLDELLPLVLQRARFASRTPTP